MEASSWRRNAGNLTQVRTSCGTRSDPSSPCSSWCQDGTGQPEGSAKVGNREGVSGNPGKVQREWVNAIARPWTGILMQAAVPMTM